MSSVATSQLCTLSITATFFKISLIPTTYQREPSREEWPQNQRFYSCSRRTKMAGIWCVREEDPDSCTSVLTGNL